MKMRAPIPATLKQAVLRKQNYKCNKCSMFLDVYDIDHIVPYRVEPVHRISNLQALCPTCHARKTRSEAKEISLFIQCENTPSYRYCWTCKKVISSYFSCCLPNIASLSLKTDLSNFMQQLVESQTDNPTHPNST